MHQHWLSLNPQPIFGDFLVKKTPIVIKIWQIYFGLFQLCNFNYPNTNVVSSYFMSYLPQIWLPRLKVHYELKSNIVWIEIYLNVENMSCHWLSWTGFAACFLYRYKWCGNLKYIMWIKSGKVDIFPNWLCEMIKRIVAMSDNLKF